MFQLTTSTSCDSVTSLPLPSSAEQQPPVPSSCPEYPGLKVGLRSRRSSKMFFDSADFFMDKDGKPVPRAAPMSPHPLIFAAAVEKSVSTPSIGSPPPSILHRSPTEPCSASSTRPSFHAPPGPIARRNSHNFLVPADWVAPEAALPISSPFADLKPT